MKKASALLDWIRYAAAGRIVASALPKRLRTVG